MTTYMADTHSLLWAFHAPRKLRDQARQAFEEIALGESKLLIPVIVLAELIFIVENKPVQADLDKCRSAVVSDPPSILSPMLTEGLRRSPCLRDHTVACA